MEEEIKLIDIVEKSLFEKEISYQNFHVMVTACDYRHAKGYLLTLPKGLKFMNVALYVKNQIEEAGVDLRQSKYDLKHSQATYIASIPKEKQTDREFLDLARLVVGGKHSGDEYSLMQDIPEIKTPALSR